MGKWSFQQELKQEKQKLDKSRREHLCKFYYDLAKLVFAGLVVGGGIQLYGNLYDRNLWIMIIWGVLCTCLIACLANKILK